MVHTMDKFITETDCSEVHYMTDKINLLVIGVQEK